MAKRPLTQCPVCDSRLAITEMQCEECETTLRGDFVAAQCKFCALPEDRLKFLELFLRCRGNLRDVERSLGLSYPTVRARLDEVLTDLGYTETANGAAAGEPSEEPDRRREILEDLNAGRISAADAAKMLETL